MSQWEMLCRNYIDYVDRSDFDVDSTWFCPPNRRIIDFDVDSMIHFSLGRGVVGPERRVASTSVGRKVGCHSDVALASHPHPPRIYNVAPRSNIARNPPHIWDPDGPQRTAKLKMRINQNKGNSKHKINFVLCTRSLRSIFELSAPFVVMKV